MDTNNDDKTILQRLDSVELKMLQEDVEYAKQCLIEQDVDVEEEKELAAKYINKIKFMVKAIPNKRLLKKLKKHSR